MLRAMVLACGWMAMAGAGGVAAQDDVPTGYSIFGWEAPEIVAPYEADRAFFTSRANAVPQGRFVVSAGATYTYNDDNDVEVQNWTAPELLIQAGILPRVNVAVGWDGSSTTEIDSTGFSDTTSGTTDMDVEVKVQLLESDSLIPAVAVTAGASLPVGSNELTSDRVDPSAGLSAWWDDFDEFWQVFGGVEFTLLEDGMNDEYTRTAISGGVGQDWGNGATTFVEYFGFLNDSDGIEDAHFVQGGIVFEAAPNVTLDARIGVGLTDESADLFAGFGGSFSL